MDFEIFTIWLDSNPWPFSTKCGGSSVVPTTTLRAKKGSPKEEPKANYELLAKQARARSHTRSLFLSLRDRRRRYLLRNSRGVSAGVGRGARRGLQNLVIILLHFPQFSSCFNWSHVPSSTCSFSICSCAFVLIVLGPRINRIFFS
jgi:hypothetical protein